MFLFCLESVDETFSMPANACLHFKSFRVSKHVKIQEKIGKTFTTVQTSSRLRRT